MSTSDLNRLNRSRSEGASIGSREASTEQMPSSADNQWEILISSQGWTLTFDSSSTPVTLHPWERQWHHLVAVAVAVILQGAFFIGSLYIWRHPVVLPIGQRLHDGLTVKHYSTSESGQQPTPRLAVGCERTKGR